MKDENGLQLLESFRTRNGPEVGNTKSRETSRKGHFSSLGVRQIKDLMKSLFLAFERMRITCAYYCTFIAYERGLPSLVCKLA